MKFYIHRQPWIRVSQEEGWWWLCFYILRREREREREKGRSSNGNNRGLIRSILVCVCLCVSLNFLLTPQTIFDSSLLGNTVFHSANFPDEDKIPRERMPLFHQRKLKKILILPFLLVSVHKFRLHFLPLSLSLTPISYSLFPEHIHVPGSV